MRPERLVRPEPLVRPYRLVRIGQDEGRTALLVDGVVQSLAPEDAAERGGYWAAMLPSVRPARALILGLGGGTLAHLLAERFGPDLPIVGVDDDPAVLDLARAHGWLDLPGLQVVQADAFAYVAACPERFAYVALDLYRGPRVASRILTRPFLRQVRDLLAPPGLVALNLFDDAQTERRIERLAQVLTVRERVLVRDNVVVHAQATSRRARRAQQ